MGLSEVGGGEGGVDCFDGMDFTGRDATLECVVTGFIHALERRKEKTCFRMQMKFSVYMLAQWLMLLLSCVCSIY